MHFFPWCFFARGVKKRVDIAQVFLQAVAQFFVFFTKDNEDRNSRENCVVHVAL